MAATTDHERKQQPKTDSLSLCDFTSPHVWSQAVHLMSPNIPFTRLKAEIRPRRQCTNLNSKYEIRVSQHPLLQLASAPNQISAGLDSLDASGWLFRRGSFLF